MSVEEEVPGPRPEPSGEIAAVPDPYFQAVEPTKRGFPWKAAAWLLAASTAGTLLVVPFSFELMRQMEGMPTLTPPVMAIIAVVSVMIEGVLAAAAIGAGLGLGPRVGLGRPMLVGIGAGPDGRRIAWKAVGQSAAIGIALGVVFVLSLIPLRPYLPDSADVKSPAVWTGFLGSIGAGIREEIWLRLGLLTFLAWLGAAIAGRRSSGAVIFWSANVLSSLLFGALHLPQASALIGLSGAVLALVFLGNGIPGLFFGWLYRSKGLVAAMTAHVTFDIVLKVIAPLLGE